MIRGMTRTRPLAVATSLSVALAGAVLLLQQPGVEAQPRATHASASAAHDGGPNTYLSTPPDPVAAAKARHRHTGRRPKAPPTRGTVTGQVTGPNGTPIPNALV